MTEKRKRWANWFTSRKVKDYDDQARGFGSGLASHATFTWRNNPPFMRRIHVPAMQIDPRLSLCMGILKGMATSLSKFYIDEGEAESDNPSEIKEFLIKQITRMWSVGAGHMLESLDWGYVGAEALYRETQDGLLAFDSFQKFDSQDVTPVTLDGELVGIEMRFRQRKFLGGQFAFWHVNGRQHNRWWGRSRFMPAYPTWNEKHDRHGALDMRRHYYFRHSFQGEVMRHPDGVYIDEHGNKTPYREIARSMVENLRSGGSLTLPSTRDSTHGELLWDLVDRQSGQTNHDVREYVENLDTEMTEAMGISEELFNAAESGSGYSGRKIPEQAVRSTLTQDVYWLMHDFDQQILRPLVRRNFGCEPDYEIIPFGLIDEDQEPVQMEGMEVPGTAIDRAREKGANGRTPVAV